MPPEANVQQISGYRIEGRVTNNLDEPLPGVDVRLGYDYDYENGDSPPPHAYTVSGGNLPVMVAVFDSRDRLVRVISSGEVEPGTYQTRWDLLDSLGRDVRAGLYEVRSIVGVDTLMVYTVVVDGTVTARSDSAGEFVITQDCLPIGYEPVPLYSADGTVFYGNYRIRSDVFLSFTNAVWTKELTVSVEKDRITPADVVLN